MPTLAEIQDLLNRFGVTVLTGRAVVRRKLLRIIVRERRELRNLASMNNSVDMNSSMITLSILERERDALIRITKIINEIDTMIERQKREISN